MAVGATGSTVVGLVDGMARGITPSGGNPTIPAFNIVVGNPDGVVTSTTGSDICYDIAGGAFYIGDITNGANGSAWSLLSTD